MLEKTVQQTCDECDHPIEQGPIVIESKTTHREFCSIPCQSTWAERNDYVQCAECWTWYNKHFGFDRNFCSSVCYLEARGLGNIPEPVEEPTPF